MKWKTFIDFGKWWFSEYSKIGFQTLLSPQGKSVTCDLTKDQIKHVMSDNRCVGYNYKDSQ